MTTEECLEIVKILDDITQNNKFYTINIYDTVNDRYLGDIELMYYKEAGDYYRLSHVALASTKSLHAYHYAFNRRSGAYKRAYQSFGSISDILSRLDAIEQKLNEITETI